MTRDQCLDYLKTQHLLRIEHRADCHRQEQANISILCRIPRVYSPRSSASSASIAPLSAAEASAKSCQAICASVPSLKASGASEYGTTTEPTSASLSASTTDPVARAFNCA